MLRFVTKRLTSAKAWMPVCFSNFCGIIDGQVMHIVSHWGGLNFTWHIQSTMIILLTKQPVGTVLGSCCRAEMSVCENRKQSWTLLRTWKKKKTLQELVTHIVHIWRRHLTFMHAHTHVSFICHTQTHVHAHVQTADLPHSLMGRWSCAKEILASSQWRNTCAVCPVGAHWQTDFLKRSQTHLHPSSSFSLLLWFYCFLLLLMVASGWCSKFALPALHFP